MGLATTPVGHSVSQQIASEGVGPLSAEQEKQLSDAVRRARKVFGATKVAAFNGWSTGFCAAISLAMALVSIQAMWVGLGLAIVSRNEFRGRNLLRWFDRRGPRILAWNQVGLLGLLVVYSLWSLYDALTGPNPYEAHLKRSPELASMLGPVGQLYTFATMAVYGGVVILAFVVQGMTALYYVSCGKHLDAYLDQTPAWIVRLQRCWFGRS